MRTEKMMDGEIIQEVIDRVPIPFAYHLSYIAMTGAVMSLISLAPYSVRHTPAIVLGFFDVLGGSLMVSSSVMIIVMLVSIYWKVRKEKYNI